MGITDIIENKLDSQLTITSELKDNLKEVNARYPL